MTGFAPGASGYARGSGLGMDRLIELCPLVRMTCNTGVGANEIFRLAGRRLPRNTEILVRRRLLLCDR